MGRRIYEKWLQKYERKHALYPHKAKYLYKIQHYRELLAKLDNEFEETQQEE